MKRGTAGDSKIKEASETVLPDRLVGPHFHAVRGWAGNLILLSTILSAKGRRQADHPSLSFEASDGWRAAPRTLLEHYLRILREEVAP